MPVKLTNGRGLRAAVTSLKTVSRSVFALQTSGDNSEAGEGLERRSREEMKNWRQIRAKLGGFHVGFADGQPQLTYLSKTEVQSDLRRYFGRDGRKKIACSLAKAMDPEHVLISRAARNLLHAQGVGCKTKYDRLRHGGQKALPTSTLFDLLPVRVPLSLLPPEPRHRFPLSCIFHFLALLLFLDLEPNPPLTASAIEVQRPFQW